MMIVPAGVKVHLALGYTDMTPCCIFIGRALVAEQERAVDLLDIDAAILHRFEGVRVLHQPPRGLFRISKGAIVGEIHAAALSSLSAPRATIFSALPGSGRRSALASSHGARNQASRSSSVVRITGMAFGWMARRQRSAR